MKFLIVGSKAHHSLESSYTRCLKLLGHEVVQWDNKEPSALFGHRSWWALPLPLRAAYDAIASTAFYREVKQQRPDVLFLPKAENIHSRAVKLALEETKARLVVWYPDHPFKADMTSMNILRNLRRCDLFYIWGKFLIDSLHAAGCRRAEYLPFGFDAELHDCAIEPSESEREKFRCRILFVGTWDREREESLRPLAEHGLNIWGPGWENATDPLLCKTGCIRGGGLYGADLVKAFKSATLVYNHLRQHNGPAHNVRTMEVTGIGGGPMIVRRTPEQATDLFLEGKHLLCFSDTAELLTITQTPMDPTQSRAMSLAARRQVLERHLLMDRLKQITSDLERL